MLIVYKYHASWNQPEYIIIDDDMVTTLILPQWLAAAMKWLWLYMGRARLKIRDSQKR